METVDVPLVNTLIFKIKGFVLTGFNVERKLEILKNAKQTLPSF